MLYYLETPWDNYFVGKLTYKMPVFKNVTLSSDTFKRIKEKAVTPNGLCLLIKFEYFVNEMTVKYKDGTFRNIVHLADYVISVP